MNSSELLALVRALAGNPHDCCWSHLPYSSSSETITTCTWITEPYAQAVSGTFYLVVRSESGDAVPFFITYDGEWSIAPAPSVCELPTAPGLDWGGAITWTGINPSDVLVYKYEQTYDSEGYLASMAGIFYGENGAIVEDISALDMAYKYVTAACYVGGILTVVADTFAYTYVDGVATTIIEFEDNTYWARINQSGTGLVRRVGYGSQSPHLVYSLEYSSSEGVVVTYVETIDDGWDYSSDNFNAGTFYWPSPLPDKRTEESCLTVDGCGEKCYESLSVDVYPAYDGERLDESATSHWTDRLYFPGYVRDTFVYGTANYNNTSTSNTHRERNEYTYGIHTLYEIGTPWPDCDNIVWGCTEGGGHQWLIDEAENRYTNELYESLETYAVAWNGVTITTTYTALNNYEDWWTNPEVYYYYVWTGHPVFGHWTFTEGSGFLPDVEANRDTQRLSTSIDQLEEALPEAELLVRYQECYSETEITTDDDYSYNKVPCYSYQWSYALTYRNDVLLRFDQSYAGFLAAAYNHNGKSLFTFWDDNRYYLFGFADGVLTDLTDLVGEITYVPETSEYSVYNIVPVSGGLPSD